MKLKNKLKRFFTLSRNHDGFTLVELIVVIAIMAILAGVGTVGYGGYVKYANKNTDKTTVLNVIRALETANNSGSLSFAVDGQYSAGLQIPVGYVVISNEPINGGGYTVTVSQGRASDDDGDGVYTYTDSEVNGADNVIAAALTSAYGKDYANAIRLKSDEWSGDATATFYASAGEMVNTVDTMGTQTLKLLDLMDKINLNVDVFSGEYENSADLMQTFAEKLAGSDAIVTKDNFLNSWENVSTEGESFGLSGTDGGREFYSAARAAYNQCFATYVNAQGTAVDEDGNVVPHSDNCKKGKIAGYGESGGELIAEKAGGGLVTQWAVDKVMDAMGTDVTFPQSVCESTFATGGSLECAGCAALYKQYKDTGMDRTNGEAFYNTMATGAAEGRDILGEDLNKNKYFSWMTANANTFAEMTNTVNNLVGNNSAVIIQVYSQGMLLNCGVSPKSILE